MNDLELAWAAGFFEGEGTVRINRATRRNLGHLAVSVVNTDYQTIEWFHARWGGYLKITKTTGNRRRAWVWTIAARKAAAFLSEIRPFIVRSRVEERIAHALYFQGQKRHGHGQFSEDYREEQWNAYMWMGHLNHRGL